MKKIVLTGLLFAAPFCSLIASTLDSKTFKNILKDEDCTFTSTVTKSALVECPDDFTFTISVTTSFTVTKPTCEEAEVVSYIAASVQSSIILSDHIQTKNYICP